MTPRRGNDHAKAVRRLPALHLRWAIWGCLDDPELHLLRKESNPSFPDNVV